MIKKPPAHKMERYQLEQLLAGGQEAPVSYLEFMRKTSLSMGLYRLRAGASDPQQPHSEDEVYYVLQGRARFCAGDADAEAAPGSILFVPAGCAHRFHHIQEDLSLLVFFAPAETAGSG